MSGNPDASARIRSDIPAALVWDKSFDSFTAELDDPYLAISRLLAGPPVIWASDAAYGRPGWVATRQDVMAEIFMDHEHFSAERPGMIADLLGVNLRLNPIEIDPPAHHGYRRILQPHFTPKAIGSLDASVRQACATLIAKFGDKGGCEFIKDFAAPFPSYIFLDLMGMPHDMLASFLAWEDNLMRGPDPMARVAAARSIYRYLEDFLAQRREQPGNDFIQAIVAGDFEGRPLTHLEIMGMLYVLYVGGLDTVYSTLGWVMRHLAAHPELQDRLRGDPDLIASAVEEFARAFPVAVTHRLVARDYLFHGAPLRKGDEIHLPTPLAGRDPNVYANPHVIDIDRKPRHITFGTGAHTCLGIHLAKREIRIVVEEFVKRFRNIRMRAGETYKYHTGRTFGVDYLPLQWDVV